MTDEKRLAEARPIAHRWVKAGQGIHTAAYAVEQCASEIAAALASRDAEIERLRQWRDDFIYHAAEWRNVEAIDLCQTCGGSGSRVYADTSTWRGGVGGQMLTADVCDLCWGSGSKSKPWPSWRKLARLRAQPNADLDRCTNCISHNLTRDVCFYEGHCIRREIQKANLRKRIEEQDAKRGRPLTAKERLWNLANALDQIEDEAQPAADDVEMSEQLSKIPDEEIYRLRDEASDGGTVTISADTLFEMCVELEIRRYDAARLPSSADDITAARQDARRQALEEAARDVATYGAALEKRETEPTLRRCVEGCAWAFSHRIRALADKPATGNAE